MQELRKAGDKCEMVMKKCRATITKEIGIYAGYVPALNSWEEALPKVLVEKMKFVLAMDIAGWTSSSS